MNEEPVLKIQNLNVNYEETPALWDLNLEVPKGHLAAIVGPNGAGKSTLLKACLGLVKPLSGKVLFFGQPLKSFLKQIAYIPQRESVDWDFPITVFDLVLMGRYGKIGMLRWAGKKDREIAWNALEAVGMKEFASRQISQLSGGQQQRVFIARSLCQEAEIYFMDEPFAGIDLASSKVVLDLLLDLRKRGKSIFVVHHDLSSVQTTYDWVIMLNMHMIACGAVIDVFTPEKICDTYGRDDLLLDQAAKLTKEKREGRK
jgi:manganese/zinc/iron transport system ATP- binding protein